MYHQMYVDASNHHSLVDLSYLVILYCRVSQNIWISVFE